MKIAFIGLGHMGGPMARNLLKAGHQVTGFDLAAAALDEFRAAGGKPAATAAEAAAGAEAIVTMLPAGQHVREVWLGSGGLLAAAPKDAILIDSSTIDVATARDLAAAAKGRDLVDAPVSGGVAAATAGTLTFMVGGEDAAFARAQPILAAMGKAVIHAGPAGNGQAAKICNNMMLAIQMISVCEGFNLAEKLGLDPQKLFQIASQASSQCWSMTSYCPVPGPVPAAPSNRDYQPGFTSAMMLKDLRLAEGAAEASGAATPLGAKACEIYTAFCAKNGQNMDFSGVIKFLAAQ